VNAWLHSRDCDGEELSQRQLAARFDIADRKKIKAWLEAAAPTPEPVALKTPALPPTEVAAPPVNGGPPA
jgi:hypothetical protein